MLPWLALAVFVQAWIEGGVCAVGLDIIAVDQIEDRASSGGDLEDHELELAETQALRRFLSSFAVDLRKIGLDVWLVDDLVD